MFANLKKKIESEVGDLSRLTPNLRSITQSEKLTPLSSRQNSVSSLASETSYSNSHKLTSPLSPQDQFHPQFGKSGDGVGSSSKSDSGSQLKIKRAYEEKLQTQELDFAWRLNSKDDEITKLQKQVDHLNSMLQSKEFETQQKLVRVQNDMDSLEGFSQQENAKIKHLLLNREEELSELRAAVMNKDSLISEFESQVKNISVENDRLRKSLDEVVGRTGGGNKNQNNNEEAENKLKHLEERIETLESEKSGLQINISSKETHIEKLQNDLKASQQEATSTADSLRKENSFVLKELKDLTLKMNKAVQENENNSTLVTKLEGQLTSSTEKLKKTEDEINQLKSVATEKDSRISEFEEKVKTMQNQNEQLKNNLQEVSTKIETEGADAGSELMAMQERISALEAEKSGLQTFMQAKDSQVEKLKIELQKSKLESVAAVENLQAENALRMKEIHELLALNESQSTQERENQSAIVATLEVELSEAKEMIHSKETELKKIASELQENLKKKENDISKLHNQIQELKQQQSQLLQSSADDHDTMGDSKFKELSDRMDGLEAAKKVLETTINTKDMQLEKLQNNLKSAQQESTSMADKLRNENSVMSKELNDLTQKIKELSEESERKNSACVKLEREISSTKEKYESHISKLEGELSVSKEGQNSAVAGLEIKLSTIQEKYNSVISNLESELSSAKSTIQSKEFELSKTISQIQELNDLNLKMKEQTKDSDDKQNSIVGKLESELSSIKVEMQSKEAELSKIVSDQANIKEQLEQKEEELSQLQQQMADLTNIEVENSEMVLQISEIQSKCDELEEENKFLKESAAAQPNEQEQFKKRISELEDELTDKTQMLKQQSHQLQDLRRSLAKEINKNQIISESTSSSQQASPGSSAGPSHCNGAMSPNPSMTNFLVQSPPTLPPQETDVNFMYLRSVLFKYLTTTDAQVTHQLHNVVAKLLHLSDEESHLLTQASESRNSFFHLIGKS